jgi:hypothetical protein
MHSVTKYVHPAVQSHWMMGAGSSWLFSWSWRVGVWCETCVVLVPFFTGAGGGRERGVLDWHWQWHQRLGAYGKHVRGPQHLTGLSHHDSDDMYMTFALMLSTQRVSSDLHRSCGSHLCVGLLHNHAAAHCWLSDLPYTYMLNPHVCCAFLHNSTETA